MQRVFMLGTFCILGSARMITDNILRRWTKYNEERALRLVSLVTPLRPQEFERQQSTEVKNHAKRVSGHS